MNSQPTEPPGYDAGDGGEPNLSELDPSWINLDTIHYWLNVCKATHRCGDYSTFGSPPTWLIDVRQECLVSPTQVEGGLRYCALSYVWGQVKTSKLTTATRDHLCQPGAFSIDSPESLIVPKTIRHAMGLVKALGETYLWVDSFCIIQDDEANFHVELKNMGAIYDRAHLTIVAATGWDADEGLRGLRGITPRRHLAANFADDLDKYTDSSCMIWNSRGWTFQEGEFSRRMLLFCDQTVLWRCSSSTLDEVGNTLGNTISHRKYDWGNKTSLVHDRAAEAFEQDSLQTLSATTDGLSTAFLQYCDTIVNPYNERNFTNPADLFYAFEGLGQALTENAAPGSLFSQGLFWGLPIAYLPQALTWTMAAEPNRARPRSLGFPTWSWFSQEGNVDLDTLPYYAIFTLWRPQVAMCGWWMEEPQSAAAGETTLSTPTATTQKAAIAIAGDLRYLVTPESFLPGTPKLLTCQWWQAGLAEPGRLKISEVAVFPDQAETDWSFPPSSEAETVLTLVAICSYYTTDDSILKMVKALWFVPCHDGTSSPNSGTRTGRCQRRGVVVLDAETWEQLPQMGGHAEVVLE